MSAAPIRFDNGAAYERGMGVWSQLAGTIFLDAGTTVQAVARALKMDLVEPKGWTCCGATAGPPRSPERPDSSGRTCAADKTWMAPPP